MEANNGSYHNARTKVGDFYYQIGDYLAYKFHNLQTIRYEDIPSFIVSPIPVDHTNNENWVNIRNAIGELLFNDLIKNNDRIKRTFLTLKYKNDIQNWEIISMFKDKTSDMQKAAIRNITTGDILLLTSVNQKLKGRIRSLEKGWHTFKSNMQAPPAFYTELRYLLSRHN